MLIINKLGEIREIYTLSGAYANYGGWVHRGRSEI